MSLSPPLSLSVLHVSETKKESYILLHSHEEKCKNQITQIFASQTKIRQQILMNKLHAYVTSLSSALTNVPISDIHA